jgi:creatinine amidohydrolase
MLGRVATAPEGDMQFDGLWPGQFGGNMDASDVREGTTVYLPVFHPGALFYYGDGHALQGDGEVCGSGLETSMEVAFRFGLQKKKAIRWPRLEDAEHLMVAGSARPLSDALRIAFVELIGWLVDDYGFDQADAYQLVSQSAVIRVANMVDPLYTVVAKFPKKWLPPPKASAVALAPGIRLADLPWTEAEPLLTRDRVVVLPLGAAAKEHGPHLLLRNDEILAEYFARRVVESRAVALLPTLTYGYYPAFLDYPGSTSVSEHTQRDTVVQIVRSVARHGPRRFYVLNTGVSTRTPLKAAAEALAREGVLMRYTDILAAGKDAEAAVRQQPRGTHADEIETSMVLFMQASAVHMDKATADGLDGGEGYLYRRPVKGGVLSPSGVYGDATLASWQKGERVTGAMVDNILKDIDGMATAPLPAGEPRSALDPVN